MTNDERIVRILAAHGLDIPTATIRELSREIAAAELRGAEMTGPLMKVVEWSWRAGPEAALWPGTFSVILSCGCNHEVTIEAKGRFLDHQPCIRSGNCRRLR